MEGLELPCRNAAEVGRAIRALGSHRYVGGRLLNVHAAAFHAIEGVVSAESQPIVEEGLSWARAILSDASVDPASRDERLYRRSSEKEAAAILETLWGASGAIAQARLRDWLTRAELMSAVSATQLPFDEAHEDDIHPLLIDAGWELLSLAELEPERHRGAIEAYGDAISFASACFEEASAIPKRVNLHELSAIGPVEALYGVDNEGSLREPLVLYVAGDETYLDYVFRGILRSAKLG